MLRSSAVRGAGVGNRVDMTRAAAIAGLALALIGAGVFALRRWRWERMADSLSYTSPWEATTAWTWPPTYTNPQHFCSASETLAYGHFGGDT